MDSWETLAIIIGIIVLAVVVYAMITGANILNSVTSGIQGIGKWFNNVTTTGISTTQTDLSKLTGGLSTGVQKAISSAGNDITAIGQDVSKTLVGGLGDVSGIFSGAVKSLSSGVSTAESDASKFVSSIASNASKVVETIPQSVSNVATAVSKDASTFVSTAEKDVSNTATTLSNISKVPETFLSKNIITPAVSTVESTASSFVNDISHAARSTDTAVSSAVSTAEKDASTFVNNISKSIGSIFRL